MSQRSEGCAALPCEKKTSQTNASQSGRLPKPFPPVSACAVNIPPASPAPPAPRAKQLWWLCGRRKEIAVTAVRPGGHSWHRHHAARVTRPQRRRFTTPSGSNADQKPSGIPGIGSTPRLGMGSWSGLRPGSAGSVPVVRCAARYPQTPWRIVPRQTRAESRASTTEAAPQRQGLLSGADC